LYLGLVGVAVGAVVALSVMTTPWALLGLGAAPLAVAPIAAVLHGATGPALVPVLRGTAWLELVVGALLALGLTLGQ
jgi:1,4-dihydroxy-2-naphthoate octaprenyltransferase